MDRTELVARLERINPALATKEIVPTLTCFCFREGQAESYDDILGLRTDLDLGFEGGLKGSVLLNYLKASRAKEVIIEPENGAVKLKLGRSKLELPLVPAEDFVFQFPPLEDGIEFPITQDFLEVLRPAAISMGVNPSHPWRLGVTVSFQRGSVNLYSCDNPTISHVEAKISVPKELVGSVLILPPRLVDQLLSRGASPSKLYFGPGWVQAGYKDSSTVLFARGIDDVRVEEFEGLLQQSTSDKVYDIPDAMAGALDRVMVVLANSTDKYADITVKAGRLYMVSQSILGGVKESFKTNHPDVEARASAEFLRRAIKHASQFHIHDNYIVFRGDKGFTHIVATAATTTQE